MDKSALMQAMKASISEVLEQMFFMPIDFLAPEKDGAEPESDPASIIARLGFSGSPSGTFVLLVPASLAQSVAADFLGAPARSLSKDQVVGTVLEMVNMLAGSTLSNYDHQALFDLQIPELITFNEVRALGEGMPDRIVIGIQATESRMTFQLILQPAAGDDRPWR
jgi:CheY-specific phosphatase CheX